MAEGAGKVAGHLLARARHDREPWGAWLFLRWLGRVILSPFTSFNRWRRLVRFRHSGVDHTRWWFNSPWFMGARIVTYFLALVFLAWLVRSLIVVIDRSPDATSAFGLNLATVCESRASECGALTGWVTSVLSIALASAVFLIWRLGRLQRGYLRAARKRPKDLVPTAGTIIGKVVGRDQLCRVVMEDLRVGDTRRPHVLIGGVGTGKTAVLVQLTGLLARRHAVPVPVRLRDAQKLDFTELARQQFLHEMDQRLSSSAEGEKVWRRLLRDGRIVVLADGLEEALADNEDAEAEEDKQPRDRDTEIRNAIREAHQRRLPLFIASRPHAPLRGMDATIHELEPLSEVDALGYITEGKPSEDDWRLSWIVEMADVAEAPLYLQITRELSDHDLLNDVVRREEQVLQSLTHDKSALRLRLLAAWEEALLNGRLYPEVPLDRSERALTLDWLSALACVGLRNDRLEVDLDDTVPASVKRELERRNPPGKSVKPRRRGLEGIDKRLAVTWGAQLGLVEVRGRKMRYEHSLMEAYLGSRLIDVMFTDEDWQQALGQVSEDEQRRHPRPGRELLIALVLYSRTGTGQAGAEGLPAGDGRRPRVSRQDICQRLRTAACGHADHKALDIYAAALEIASAPDQEAASRPQAETRATVTTAGVAHRRQALPSLAIEIEFGTTGAAPQRGGEDADGQTSLSSIGAEIRERWGKIRSDDLQTLEEAKIGLVCRFGDALRTRSESAHGRFGHLGYQELYDICCQEDSYRVRLAGAQEIGRGGCAAYAELKGTLDLSGIDERPGRLSGQGQSSSGNRSQRSRPWAWQVSAWLVPLLAGSVPQCQYRDHDHERHEERGTLQGWLNHLPRAARGQAADRDWLSISQEITRAKALCPEHDWLSISEEIALAQGFKYAANVRHRQLHSRPDAWSYLEGKALEMLRDASYWFSELTLIQALTLWALPEGNRPLPEEQQQHRHDSAHGLPQPSPDQTVERWLDIVAGKASDQRRRGSRRVHPFVEAAADMANRALAVQQAGRFLWMDESDVVSRIGAGQPKPAPPSSRRPRLWIPPSMGWSALDPEAQQLLADVLLLLNLTERGGTDKTEDRLLLASKHKLPPCITNDRRPLQPLLTVGSAGVDRQGESCLDGCQFQLCPYPPKGLQHHRTELSEEFCRRQYRLVRRYLRPLRLRRRTARWQGMTAGRLRVFWTQMAERARNSPG